MSIIASNINYSIGKKQILSDVSIKIHPGELHVLLGRNGAGKSTLFHILCGDTIIQTGNVRLNQKDINSFSKMELAKTRAVLTQETMIQFPILSKDVVRLGRYPHGTNQSINNKIVETCIAITSSTNQKEQNFSTLSGGEKQKINFARILTQIWETPPRYIFLDEPVSALDIPNQYKTLNICRHMADKGYAVFLILHDLNLAFQYADQITLLEEGKILRSGKPNEVMTSQNLESAFGIKTKIVKAENTNFIIPEKIGETI